MGLTAAVAWFALGLAAWTLAGYPAVAAAVGAVLRRRPRADPAHRPPLSVLVAAHDEADVIEARVADVLAQDYPRDRLEVIVVDDGSADGTAARAAAAGARTLRQPRAGKVAALARAVDEARGEIVVLTDANTRFAPGALRALASTLADPAVGAACGDLRYEDAAGSLSGAGESSYWSMETRLKAWESAAGWMLMGAGGIYAVRRRDWPDVPRDTADDSYVPLTLRARGLRVAFVRDAVAFEPVGRSLDEEWRRRVRMVSQDARVVSAVLRREGLWRRPGVVLALLSHKVLRWLLLPLLVAALGAGAAAGSAAAVAPAALFLAAAAGGFLHAAGVRPPAPLGVAFYAVAATAAAAVGLLRGLSGRSPSVWSVAPSTRNR